jgi:hypothetical protein
MSSSNRPQIVKGLLKLKGSNPQTKRNTVNPPPQQQEQKIEPV